MTATIRASSLTGFRALVGRLGGAPEPLLLRAGIAPEVAENSDEFISYRAVAAVLDLAARELKCPDFGLRLSELQDLQILGPVALIARHAPSVGAALAGIRKFMDVYSPAIAISVTADGPIADYRFEILLRDLRDVAQISELSLGTSLQVWRLLVGGDFSPTTVSFVHHPATPLATYEAYFGCPIHTGVDHLGFEFDSDILQRAVPGSDPAVAGVVAEYLREVSTSHPRSLTAQVQAMVKRALPTGYASIEAIADELAMHPRTLQRRLSAHGMSYAVLIDGVRRDLAEHYLRTTEMPLSQLTRMLSYSEQSTLSRSCVRWFGCSPRAVRTDVRDQFPSPA